RRHHPRRSRRLLADPAGRRPGRQPAGPHQRPPPPRPLREPDRPHALPLARRPAAHRGGAGVGVADQPAGQAPPGPLPGPPPLPLLRTGAPALRLPSPGPVFYRQVRIGRDRRPFTLWKLRTMREGAEASGDEVLAQEGDPRLTPAGAFLRRTRLDEIPQLWN